MRERLAIIVKEQVLEMRPHFVEKLAVERPLHEILAEQMKRRIVGDVARLVRASDVAFYRGLKHQPSRVGAAKFFSCPSALVCMVHLKHFLPESSSSRRFAIGAPAKISRSDDDFRLP